MRQGYDYPEDPSSYSAAWSSFTEYGREPACTAAFSSFIATQPTITRVLTFAESFTLPDGRDTVGVVYDTLVAAPDEDAACCAKCTLFFQSLEMLYWPGPHPQTACTTASGSIAGNATSWSTLDSEQEGNGPNIYATGSDGYILSVLNRDSIVRLRIINAVSSTSPSVYIGFPLVSASDDCGPVGPTFTSLTLAFAPGELSTMLYYGAPPDDPYGMSAVSSRVLDTNDLPCGPLDKAGNWWVQDGVSTGYQPLVELPTKLQQLVPAWSSCYGNAFQGQDPPRTLSPGTRLTPEPTTVHANPQKTPAAPSPSIPSLPVKTGAGAAQPLESNPATDPKAIAGPVADPDRTTMSNTPQVSGMDPGASGGGGGGVAAGAKVTNSPHVDPASPESPVPTLSPAIVVQGQTITNNAAPVTVDRTIIAYQAGSIRVNNEVLPYPAVENLDTANASPVTVGGLTFSAVASIVHLNDGAQYNVESNALPANDPGAATYITISGHPITVQANRIVVAGKTLYPGDPGITVAGSPISLGSSEFVIGDHTETFPPPATVATLPSQITVNEEPISLASDSIIVDGTTLKPGDPSITIHGQAVSLGASEVAVGGVTASLALAAAIATRESSYTTLNGEAMTLGAGEIAIKGKTLKPSDRPISIDGKLISLGSSNIVVGSITASLTLSGAATEAPPSFITVNGETVAVKGSNVVVKGSTLNAGDTGITIDGKTVSLGSSGLVVDGITEAIRFPDSAAKTSGVSYITFGGETVAVGAGSVVIDGATLTPGGPALNLDGTTMSLGSSVLIVGTQTTQLSLRAAPTSSSGSSEGIGALIMAGLGRTDGGSFISPGTVNVSLGQSGNEGNDGNGVIHFVGEGTKRFGPVTAFGWFLWATSLGLFVF